MNNTTIKIKNLSFFYDMKKQVFDNFSCEIPCNQLTLLMGKNGSGKSTLFNVMQGLDLCVERQEEQFSGTISYGHQIFDLYTKAYRQFAYDHVRVVPQNFDRLLAPHLTLQENLACAQLSIFRSLFGCVKEKPVPAFIADFDIPLSNPVGTFSGGQRQILAILMALAKPTTLLLLDEPTATLDPENSAMVMQFLQNLLKKQKGLTIFMICHDVDLVRYTKSIICI